tara:strand:+ start:3656 stop:3808 length:153 start_codon:yes stop_codon:yes gene_type:complete
MNEGYIVYGIGNEPRFQEFRTAEETAELALEIESRRRDKRLDDSRPYSDK